MFVPRIPPDGIIVESTGLHLKLFSKRSHTFPRNNGVGPKGPPDSKRLPLALLVP